MKIPHGHGFGLTGGAVLNLVLTNSATIQGRLIAVIGDRADNNNDHCGDEVEFLLLQLTCPFSIFSIGDIVAVNVAQISFIGSGFESCALS